MTRRIVWAGCGRHSEAMLLPQLVRHDVELVGVCDLDLDAARKLARRYGVPHFGTDFADALALPDIDVAGMAVGPVQHRDLAIAALRRGLHVFMEKPCGASAADARAIADAARAAQRTVGIGFMKRFSTANRIAHNVLRAPTFGPVIGFFGEYMTAPTYFSGAADYTPFFLHHCVHYMDLPRYLVGAPIDSVTVFPCEHAPGKLLLHVHLGFANGAVGTVIMGTLQSRGTPMERLQIMGDHQRVEVDGVFEVRHHRNPPFKSEDAAATLADGIDTLTWKPNLTAAANEDFKGYHALFGAFFAALDGAADTDLPTIDDGVLAMQVLEAMIAGATHPGVAQGIVAA
jgi:myo-inositol 2-dehydrogenase/D-chiro-inositol 1-dehydrogenase